MADEVDRAQHHNEMHLAISLQRWRTENAAAQGTAICIECDEPIPAARRRANPAAVRCIGCQTEFERSPRHGD